MDQQPAQQGGLLTRTPTPLSKSAGNTCWLTVWAAALVAVGSVQGASFQVLYAFPPNCGPNAPVVQGRDGAFYGTAS
jgi:hypothetical protein